MQDLKYLRNRQYIDIDHKADKHPGIIEMIVVSAIAVSVWIAVGYIAIVQLTGGF